MAPAVEEYRAVLRRLRTREGLTADRLDVTQVDFDVLLESPIVKDRASRSDKRPGPALIEAVAEVVETMAPTPRLILDAALRLRISIERSHPVYARLYAADLTERRRALLGHWDELHALGGATDVPRKPSETTLRTTGEDEAFLALAREMVAGYVETLAKQSNRTRTSGRAVVVGSAVTDHLYRVPAPIDTTTRSVQATNYTEQPGGKGLTQAVALARLGFEVDLVAAIGNDPGGRRAVQFLHREGIGTGSSVPLPGATPHVTVITDDATGTSFAVAWPNPDLKLTADDVEPIVESLGPSDFLFFTFEIPPETMRSALRRLDPDPDQRPTVFVTPAPPSDVTIDHRAFRNVDYLVAHELELDALVPARAGAVEEQARTLRVDFGIDRIIVCEGPSATVYGSDEPVIARPELDSRPVETAGGREVFNAALAVKIADARLEKGPMVGLPPEALEFALTGMNLVRLQLGVADSLPTRADIEDRYRRSAS